MNWNYVSGFFDADGSVTLTRPSKNKNKTLVIAFHNTEKSILQSIKDFIEENIGIKGSFATKPPKKRVI